MIGVGGRTARSLRTILTAVGKENRHNYLLDVDGFAIDEGADTFNEPVDAPYWERRQVASRRG